MGGVLAWVWGDPGWPSRAACPWISLVLHRHSPVGRLPVQGSFGGLEKGPGDLLRFIPGSHVASKESLGFSCLKWKMKAGPINR